MIVAETVRVLVPVDDVVPVSVGEKDFVAERLVVTVMEEVKLSVTGASRCVDPPFPSSPNVSSPQHDIAPPASNAHV